MITACLPGEAMGVETHAHHDGYQRDLSPDGTRRYAGSEESTGAEEKDCTMV